MYRYHNIPSWMFYLISILSVMAALFLVCWTVLKIFGGNGIDTNPFVAVPQLMHAVQAGGH